LSKNEAVQENGLRDQHAVLEDSQIMAGKVRATESHAEIRCVVARSNRPPVRRFEGLDNKTMVRKWRG